MTRTALIYGGERNYGRETKFSWAMVEAACLLIREGVKPIRALKTLGATDQEWYYWRGRAKRDIEPYASRVAEIETAEAMFLSEVEINFGRNAKKGDWHAAESMLKRRLREEYGDKVETIGDPDAIESLTHEELVAEAVELGVPTRIFED